MISFVNTKKAIVFIPEGADTSHRSKVHKYMSKVYGVYETQRWRNSNPLETDVALVEFDPDGCALFIMEISAKPNGWSWQKFVEVGRETKLVPINSGSINQVKFCEL